MDLLRLNLSAIVRLQRNRGVGEGNRQREKGEGRERKIFSALGKRCVYF